MTRNLLEGFLPAFVLVFLAVRWLWTNPLRRKNLRVVLVRNLTYRRLTIVEKILSVKLIVLFLIVIMYSYFPGYYEFVGPIPFLDHPVINTIGVLILKLSLVWIIVAQLNIDRAIFMINSGMEEWSSTKLIMYSVRLLLIGTLIMSMGLFVTISNIATALIAIGAVLVFLKSSLSQSQL